ncbi:PAAR domain-containing protein [Duganella sp. FT134W]|uniref:PAAR domain-containing protein n=1 Tax=Duganella margarita TaxID=2692170 RepID=A0A7X4GX92_9BURK|nr:PAAR domain-containing protein [Duganella margarita]
MGEKAIIRLGDKTSHNGTVLEGYQDTICMGKPVAGIGHKVSCPKCSGSHTIVEGVMSFFVMGRNIAVDGMKTSCGAVLIASQQTDTVEAGGGAAPAEAAATAAAASAAAVAAAAALAASAFDEQFQLVDRQGKPLANAAYKIVAASGQEVEGVTDASGKTQRIKTAAAEQLQIYLKS